jgi:hypothetical protein
MSKADAIAATIDQDGPGAVAAPSSTPTTADALQAAQQAHTDAIARLAEARLTAASAREAVTAAQVARQALIAAGTATDAVLQDARQTVAVAEDRADIAAERARLAEHAAERAHIAVLHTQAAHVRVGFAASMQHQVAAAENVDSAFTALQKAINDYDDASFDRLAATQAVDQHNTMVGDAVRSNRTLGAMQPNQHPVVRGPVHVQLPTPHAVLVSAPKSEVIFSKIDGPIAGRVRSILGLPPGAA